MQASFERIIRVLSERSLGGACDLPSWSSAVAAHVALDALRRRVRERKLFRDEPVVEGVRAVDNNPERAAAAGQDVARVQGVLARMKPKHAEAVLLHDVLGHDLSEIATITGASVAAAQSRLVRGRKELLAPRARGKARVVTPLEPELEQLLGPLREGPVALSGSAEQDAQRERLLPALRAEVERVPARLQRARFVRRASAGVGRRRRAGRAPRRCCCFVQRHAEHAQRVAGAAARSSPARRR